MLPASSINAMRREVLAELTARRGRVALPKTNAYNKPALYDGMSGEPQLTVAVRSASQITPRLISEKPAVLYVPLSELYEHPELTRMIGVETQLAAILPRVVWSGENPGLAEQLKSVYLMGVRQLLVGNLGQIKIAKAAGFAVRGDFGLNIYNSRAMHYLRTIGVDSQLLSFEMTMPQIRDVSKAVPSEVMIYGRLPLMLMENCVMKNENRHVLVPDDADEAHRPHGRGIPDRQRPRHVPQYSPQRQEAVSARQERDVPRYGTLGPAAAIYDGKRGRGRPGALRVPLRRAL